MENSALLLAKNDKHLKELLSEEQLNRIDEYRSSSTQSCNRDPQSITRNKSIEDTLLELGNKLDVLSNDVKQAVSHAKSDPVASLARARVVLENLILTLYRKIMLKEPKKYEIGYMLNDNQFMRNIKPRILSRMNAVRDMGNIASHVGKCDSTDGDRVTPKDAFEALEDLSVIFTWYLKNYGEKIDHSPESQFQEFCKRYYATGLPSSEDRKKIEAFRKELGFTPEKARVLERKAIPAEIRELMGAIELACADGLMNKDEEKHLYAKAKELGIREDLASQLIEKYGDTIEASLVKQFGDAYKKLYYNEDGTISIPTDQQRKEMVQLQERLKLSDDEALEIERKVMLSCIRELQTAIKSATQMV